MDEVSIERLRLFSHAVFASIARASSGSNPAKLSIEVSHLVEACRQQWRLQTVEIPNSETNPFLLLTPDVLVDLIKPSTLPEFTPRDS